MPRKEARINEGDWVEGEPQWWWKYVFPTRAQLWALLVADRFRAVAGPHPEPWREQVLGDVLEAAALLQAINVVDDEVSGRLKEEARARLSRAIDGIQ